MDMNAHDIRDRISGVEVVNDYALRFDESEEVYISGVLDAVWGEDEYRMCYPQFDDEGEVVAVYDPQG